MMSSADQTVDLNAIPLAMIDRIDVITGGAGAAYGTDAIAGAVNIRLKRNFQGLDLRATYGISTRGDARESLISGVAGLNFAEGRGNVTVGGEISRRASLGKADRPFSLLATSTTGSIPEGRYVETGNSPSQAAVNAVFARYGVAAGAVLAGGSNIGFNADNTLFSRGVFNSPLDVQNFRYPVDQNVNTRFFPDLYSYNFDSVNLLVLPLNRKTGLATAHFEFDKAFDLFGQASYTKYDATTALAPTPVGGTTIEATSSPTNPQRAKSIFIVPGQTSTSLVVPITNPFIPADLATLLASRTGDNTRLVGSGATEPFLIQTRTLGAGPRLSKYTNEVQQYIIGARGDIGDIFKYEVSYSYGCTKIDQVATGNINVQAILDVLASPTGTIGGCTYNPFGRLPLTPGCVAAFTVTGNTSRILTQRIAQGSIQADIADLPGGKLAVLVGAEERRFRNAFDPGALSGPIAGFNTASPELGTNVFTDYFAEIAAPLLKNAPFAEQLDINLGFRRSRSVFNDVQNKVTGTPTSSNAYKAEVTWAPVREFRLRGSYQRSVRAPNFSELFAGGGSFPQFFDPCSNGTAQRTAGGTQLTALCLATGVGAPATFVGTPGAQVFLSVAGNTKLQPEKADTFTVGGVFEALGLRGSIDYYNILITNAITAPDPNVIIASCYNLNGRNSTYSAASPFCSGIVRNPDISLINVPTALGGDASGAFLQINGGRIKTSGIDFALAGGTQLGTLGNKPIRFNADLLVSYLIDFKFQELPGLTNDYAGTVTFFGQGLGTSQPRWRGTLNANLDLGGLDFSTRVRYIDKMINRATLIYGADRSITGVPSVWYFDAAVSAKIDKLTFRLGVNNMFNRQPPTYAPNVQSGTESSLYDVVGRRVFAQVGVKF